MNAKRMAILGAVSAALIAPAACHRLQVPWLSTSGTPEFTEQELRADLANLAILYSTVIQRAADEITEQTTSRSVKRAALLWKIRMIPAAQRLAFEDDPQQAFVSMLIMSVSLRYYLTEGDGTNLFGGQQQIASGATEVLEARALVLGQEFLSSHQLELLASQVEELVRQHPITGIFVPETISIAAAEAQAGMAFGWVVDIPMVPFRALTGVSEGAQAIREFDETARLMARIVATMPEITQWRMQLLLYDIEEQESVIAGLDAWERIAESFTRISEATASLPEDLRVQLTAVLEQVDSRQEDLRRTLADTRATVADMNQAIVAASGLAEQVELAGVSWAAAFGEIRAMQGEDEKPAEGEASGHQFDIREYESTARELKGAAAEIKELVAEIRALVDSQQLAIALGDVQLSVDRASASGEALVDAAAWRGFQLLIALFVLLLVYRVISSRMAR